MGNLRVGREAPPPLDILSFGRMGPQRRDRLPAVLIEQIARTVRRTPEVMVKVTGGGSAPGAVAAHFSYISGKGRIDIETDDGERVDREGQKELLKDWHLELTPGQYRKATSDGRSPRRVKLVHHVVLSMPRPTPPEKVLAAAKAFARERFALRHRYAMALHTHQDHPHVHLVVKSEGNDGRRLHIDKAMLREWREDFARLMREQGVAANATPRVLRGRPKGGLDSIQGLKRSKAQLLRDKMQSIASELSSTGTVRDPARPGLLQTRKLVVDGWMKVASALDAQGQEVLAGDVRYFAKNLPPVLTDRERLAAEFLQYVKSSRASQRPKVREREREYERSR